MEDNLNTSILDKILSNQKAEEVARLNAVEIINSLFDKLNERERDVLRRRFGLHGKEKETLENIGGEHKLTRERIRQIEIAAVKKLRQLNELEDQINNLKKVIVQLLEEHGGFMERDFLLDVLVNFSTDGSKTDEDKGVHKSHFDFLLSKILDEEFEEVNNSSSFKSFLKFKYQSLDHLERLAEELVAKIRDAKKIFATSELINLARELDSFKAEEEKFKTSNNIDISQILKEGEEGAGLINENKALYSILKAHKDIEQNEFGHWGMSDWPEIKPRTINNKIYLILKNHGKPMHFTEIADKINEMEFDTKRANAATVHNELILDDKYILIGRGLYGLKEWGYKSGTVADVIADILAAADKPLTREEIIEKVLEQRLVKKATIVLALMNKERFKKAEDGRYSLDKK